MANDILIIPGSAKIEFSGSVSKNIELQVGSNGDIQFVGTTDGILLSLSEANNKITLTQETQIQQKLYIGSGSVAANGLLVIDGNGVSEGLTFDTGTGAEKKIWNDDSDDSLNITIGDTKNTGFRLDNTGEGYLGGNRILTTADSSSLNVSDADTVDGLHASEFIRKNANTTQTINLGTGALYLESSSDGMLILRQAGISGTGGVKDAGWNYIQFMDSENDRQGYFGIHSNGDFVFASEITGNVKIGNNIVWHAGNMGPGSTLDSDLLDGQEGTYYLDYNNFTNVPNFDTDFAGKSTTDLAEGTNLYYTTARANSAIDARVTKAFVDALNVNADTLDGIDISNIARTDITETFTQDLVIQGNLTVQGTTTTVSSNEVNIGDNIIVLNADETGAPTENAGIEIERGTSTNVLVRWNESSDIWEFTNNGTNYYPLPTSTTDLAEGSNLYYTTARANSAIDARVNKAFVDALNVNADTLDGFQGSSYLRSDTSDTFTGGTLFINNDLKGSDYSARLREISIIQSGYVEQEPINFRFDQDCVRHANRNSDWTITSDLTSIDLDDLFSKQASHVNLADYTSPVSVELTGLNIGSTANSEFWPYVLMHAGVTNVLMEVQKSGNPGVWEELYNGTVNGYHIAKVTSGTGNLIAVRWTFSGWTGNTYVRRIGVISRNGDGYSDTLLKSGDTIYGDLDTATGYQLKVEGNRVLTVADEGTLNAGTLDSLNSTQFLRSDISDTMTGNLIIDNGTNTTLTVTSDDDGMSLIRVHGAEQGTGAIQVGQSASFGGGISYNGDGTPAFVNGEIADKITFYRIDNGVRNAVFYYGYNSDNVIFNATPQVGSDVIWHAGNDGPSSGLDADTLDGVEGAGYLRSNVNDTYNSDIWLYFGSGLGSVMLSHNSTVNDLIFRPNDGTYNTSKEFKFLGTEGYWEFEDRLDVGGAFNVTGAVTFASTLSVSGDPSIGNHVGNRDYNDTRYARLGTDNTITGDVTVNRLRITATDDVATGSILHGFQVGSNSSTNIVIDGNEIMARNNGAVSTLGLNADGGDVLVNGSRVLTTADEGHGGGINADTVDGVEGSNIVQLGGTQTLSGDKTFADNKFLAFGTGNDLQMYHTGSNAYMDMILGNIYLRDNTTIRFTFERTTGNFTATGSVNSDTAHIEEEVQTQKVSIDDASDNKKFEVVYNAVSDSLDFNFVG